MNKKATDFIVHNMVVILFVILCVLATFFSKQPLTFVVSELFTRIARNSFIVLSLIIPVIAGMGLNFGIVIGAMAAQLAHSGIGHTLCSVFRLFGGKAV